MQYVDHLEEFRDALIDAFRLPKAMDRFARATGHVRSLAIDVGEGALNDVVYDFLDRVDADGGEPALAAVLKLARAKSPGNRQLLAFAQKMGVDRPAIAIAAELLHTHSFDLRPLEAVWNSELARPPRRLVAFVLCGAEQAVISNVIDRLRLRLGVPASTSASRLRLDEKFTPIATTITLIGKLKARLKAEHVVCMVDADNAPDEAVALLLATLFADYGVAQDHHLALLVNVRADCAVPAGGVRLPLPQFRETDLYEWVEDVTRDKNWPPALCDAFKAWLHSAAGRSEAPATEVAYFALEDAIALLRQNLSHAALQEHFRSPP